MTFPENDMAEFQKALQAEGYLGEVAQDYATRTVFATDNSIYERRPLAILYPLDPEDLNRIMRAAHYHAIALTARGGGTGTNGQSLTDSVIVDCSRHLTRIESIDPESQIAVVQPGVILDQLNRAAGEHGLFFAPTVSTASRATLGGMAATDASGKGSRVHGRTSDHVLAMDVVLSDGSNWRAEPLAPESLDRVCARSDLPGAIHREVRRVLSAEAEEIARVFPTMNRGLTGYNLNQIFDSKGRFRLSKLLSGSEGTLALTKRMTVQLTRKKAFRALMIVSYDDAHMALVDVQRLVEAKPLAIEFIDDKIAELAQQDPVWTDIEAVLSNEEARPVRGLNFVEVQTDSQDALEEAITKLAELGGKRPTALICERVVQDQGVINRLWDLRAKCVGLLGRMDVSRQGTPFVEDAAVPPEKLPEFVAGMREILDRQGLAYGMFGHADVGCVHVRPALDMRNLQDAAKIRPVSDAVAKLAREKGGLIWGEHGKGVRSEYVPQVFGRRLYEALCDIKAVFDPHNLLNPGKIAAPRSEQKLLAVDAVPFRGSHDAAIWDRYISGFEKSVSCNGNGQCFNIDFNDTMCPSYKVSGDRRLSPKGRAALIREWLRLRSVCASGGADATEARDLLPELEQRLCDSLEKCLGCKACASQCPVKVDIPDMRSHFFEVLYQRRRRPLRHYLLAAMETCAPLLRTFPGLSNLLLRSASGPLRASGLVDLPRVRPAYSRRHFLRRRQKSAAAVNLIEDSFSGTFDGAVIDTAEQLLQKLGYQVFRTRPQSNGKALHVLGMRKAFARGAKKAIARIRSLEKSGVPLLVLEPSVHSLWRDEYRAYGAKEGSVLSLDMFLSAEIAKGRLSARPQLMENRPFHLFTHCTEKASDSRVASRWQAIFEHFGLTVEPQQTGCCGMAGSFGHEVENLDTSKRLYDLSWREKVESAPERAMATGFSCRCQTERFSGRRVRHPVELLAEIL
ncbi:FAD-binding and (Fe-S)-binding domain-containing protein [Leisingera daeponensis]|uniref:FAD-binding and (Fe-S)-binding domain-containing protein n=1 Tax=Leisingera daeponensis TaxID=405746 RepID=UPI001C98507F|nr:FAD-binding and (Fe-S)-binding domain-containing protein [Leisingera daeponensis]MBY6059558.1 FAD-binding oxidoreductase [Leisingera daeponensis]